MNTNRNPPTSDFRAASCGAQSAECRPGATRHPSPVTRHASPAFTMIEIAISLAIIGFALVAIIGILPTGMQTQKDNRQETIINQDASVFLDAIRNGEQGLDDLTNYIVAITNSVTQYGLGLPTTWHNFYTYNNSSTTPPLLLTNGAHIVGLLSTPRIIALPSQGPRGAPNYVSNHVVAYVRSMSGNAAEKAPASYTTGINPVQDLAFTLGFSYRLISDVVPYSAYDTNTVWFNQTGISTNVAAFRLSTWRYMQNLQTNLHDLRLTFRWPLLPNGDAGPGRQVFRTAAAGLLSWTNENLGVNGSWPQMDTTPNGLANTLFFFRPRTYLEVQTP